MNIQKTAPICLFVYNRLDHTKRTIDALRKNWLAEESDLVIFSDAPKSETKPGRVQEVRYYIQQINGFKSVSIVERETNLGLARSIIDGVTTIVNKYGRIIVLEDDMVTSPHFLTYMNEALEKYADDDRVISIHGYVYPVKEPLPEAFFLPGADCWGWATWDRGWKLFNSDGQYLLDELKRRKLTQAFDYNGTYPFLKMLKNQIKGKNDSWAIRWFVSAFLAGGLTLYPGRSLVLNIGNDSSGTNCRNTNDFDAEVSCTPIKLTDYSVEVSGQAMSAFENHFRELKVSRFWNAIRKLVNFFTTAKMSK